MSWTFEPNLARASTLPSNWYVDADVLAAAFIVTNTFETVIAKLAFFFVANYTLSFVTLFVLRRREPDAPRPYRAWGHPYTTALAVLASLAFLGSAVASDTKSSLWAIGLLLLSVPVFLLVKRRAPVASDQ